MYVKHIVSMYNNCCLEWVWMKYNDGKIKNKVACTSIVRFLKKIQFTSGMTNLGQEITLYLCLSGVLR